MQIITIIKLQGIDYYIYIILYFISEGVLHKFEKESTREVQ